jgi:hypothetical protein
MQAPSYEKSPPEQSKQYSAVLLQVTHWLAQAEQVKILA